MPVGCSFTLCQPGNAALKQRWGGNKGDRQSPAASLKNSQSKSNLSSRYLLKFLCNLNLDAHFLPDLTLIQQEVDALEELSRQLFLETADLYATKVQSEETAMVYQHG